MFDTWNVQNPADISIYNECEHDVEIDPDIFYDVSTPELDIEPDKDETDNESAPAIQNLQDNEDNIHLHLSMSTDISSDNGILI